MKYLILTVLLASGVYGQTDWTDWTTGPTPTPSTEFDCPSKDDSIHPDPNDCSKYFVCTNNLAWHESCPPGLLFDSILLECTWPDEANCGGPHPSPTTPRVTTAAPTTTTGAPPTTEEPSTGSTQEPETTTTGPPMSTTAAPVTTTSAPASLTPSDGFQCPQPEGTFPNPTDCSKYYVCVSGTPFPEQCPDGLWWDNDLKVCNWPSEVRCEIIQHHKFGLKAQRF